MKILNPANIEPISRLEAEIVLYRHDARSVAKDYELDQCVYKNGGITANELERRKKSCKRKLIALNEKIQRIQDEVNRMASVEIEVDSEIEMRKYLERDK